MTMAPALFRSQKTEWETPPELFAVLNREFSFTLDVCALCDAHKPEVRSVLHARTGRLTPTLVRHVLDEPTLRARHRGLGEKGA